PPAGLGGDRSRPAAHCPRQYGANPPPCLADRAHRRALARHAARQRHADHPGRARSVGAGLGGRRPDTLGTTHRMTGSTFTLAALNAASPAEFGAACGDIFEHSPWVAEGALPHRPFISLAALHGAMIASVGAASAEQRLALIRAHPDLANKTARGALTPDSTSEQHSAGLDQLSDDEYTLFHRLNADY